MTRIKSKKFLVSKNSVFVLLVMVCGFSPAQAERTFSYSYNSQGLIETLDGARTDVVDITRFEYDAQGNRTKIINALGQTVHITEHDPSGHPLRVIDPNGAITELEYDRRGRLISQTVERNSTQLSYDATGNLKQITQATGQTFTYDYDEAHRLTGYRDALGNQVSYTLDAAGNRLSEILSDSNHTLTKRHEFVYDKLGRLINDISASEQLSTLAYDNNNNQTYLTDAKGNPTQFSFDALNRLTKTTDANNGQSHYQYDSRDNLVSVIDPNGHSTSYRYDEFNNLIEQNSPDTGITSYTTDSAGNRLSQTNAKGITTRYTYDALNRLTSVNYPDHSQDVTYQYDENAAGQNGIGRLTTQKDGSGTTEYAYDKQGSLVTVTTSREIESQETETLNLEYAYNKADQLTQITYPDQRTVNYQYDITGRLSVITTTNKQGEKQTILTDIRYQPFGPVISQTWGNELTSQHVMDLDYRQMQLDTPTILTRQYEYDENNNIIDINDELVINNSQHFSYDILDRLTQAHNQNYGDIDYAYDLTHNRLQKTIVKNNQTEQQDYHYQQDNNQITRVKSKDYQYDETGNIIDNGRYQFDYGDDNRLNSVSQNGQLIARYRYNAQGQRTRKTVNQITTQYYYNQVGQLLAEMTQGNQRQLRLLQEQAQQLQQEIEQTQLQKQHQENQQTRQQTLIQTLEQNQTNAQTAKRKADQQAKRQSSQLRHSQFIIRILTRLQQRYDYNWWKTLFQSWININQQREQKLQQQLNLTQQKIVEQQDIIDTLGQSLEQAHHDLANTQQHILQLQQQRQDQQQQLEKIEQQIRGIEQQGSSAETHIKNYFYAQGRLIAIAKEEALYYVHTDHLATPQIITDQTQQIVWQASYTPFGKTTVQKQTITNNIRFPGQYYDEETGLHYNYFRYYDPEIGRYITSDPIGLAGGMNTYAYVGGNPLKYSDPRGLAVLQAISWCGTNPACTAAMVQSARKVAQACMIGATAVAGGFWGVLNGAIDSPQNETDSDRKEWIYGPEKDSKVNSDGSTNNNTWTTPDDYSSPGEAQDYLDPFKPMNGRRPVTIPKGTPIQEGTTPGGEGLYNGSGGANETLIPNGLPSGAAGSWKPL